MATYIKHPFFYLMSHPGKRVKKCHKSKETRHLVASENFGNYSKSHLNAFSLQLGRLNLLACLHFDTRTQNCKS